LLKHVPLFLHGSDTVHSSISGERSSTCKSDYEAVDIVSAISKLLDISSIRHGLNIDNLYF
jgi:hypothetical protein